jgi:CSLREA domain-containing protein
MKSPPRINLLRKLSGKLRMRLIFAAIALATLLLARQVNAAQGTYFVNTTSDAVVVNACEGGGAGCSLRAAISAANNHPGGDGILIALPPGSVINLTSALPNITESVSINGQGADKLTVRRNAGGAYRIFSVTATTGTVSFYKITISNGLTFDSGGGIQNLNNCTVNVSGTNVIANAAFDGGGISNVMNGTVNIINSAISGNSASNNSGGGGGLVSFGGTINITNSTISGNAATNNGGGLLLLGATNISNSTIAGNSADFKGGGIFASGVTVKVESSIIALNTADSGGPDLSGTITFTSNGFNLIGKTGSSTGFTQATDQTGTNASPLDPRLDPNGLQNNGGLTPTIALGFGSPALDRGTSDGLTGSLTTDQRGAIFPARLTILQSQMSRAAMVPTSARLRWSQPR